MPRHAAVSRRFDAVFDDVFAAASRRYYTAFAAALLITAAACRFSPLHTLFADARLCQRHTDAAIGRARYFDAAAISILAYAAISPYDFLMPYHAQYAADVTTRLSLPLPCRR